MEWRIWGLKDENPLFLGDRSQETGDNCGFGLFIKSRVGEVDVFLIHTFLC